MEIAITIATIIGGIVGVVQLVKWVRSTPRPYLDFDIRYGGGTSRPLGISPRARPNPGEDFFRADETLHCYELTKKFTISLINNSEVAALYPTLYIYKNSFKPKISRFNSLTPVKSHETLTLNAAHMQVEEKLPRERTQLENFPSIELKTKFRLVVEYQDAKRKKFYTLFDGSNNQSQYIKRLPKDFEAAQLGVVEI